MKRLIVYFVIGLIILGVISACILLFEKPKEKSIPTETTAKELGKEIKIEELQPKITAVLKEKKLERFELTPRQKELERGILNKKLKAKTAELLLGAIDFVEYDALTIGGELGQLLVDKINQCYAITGGECETANMSWNTDLITPDTTDITETLNAINQEIANAL